MDVRDAFVANNVRSVVERGDLVNHYPFMESFENGVVLIIDVSGYSQLAAYLQQQYGDTSGARIQTLLNPHFSGMIDAVHRHAGSVVKFAGDSLVAVWTSSSNGANGSRFLSIDEDGNETQFNPQPRESTMDMQMRGVSTRPKGFCDLTSAFLCGLDILLMVDVLGRNMEGDTASPEQQILQGVTAHMGLGTGVTNHVHVGKPTECCEYFVSGASVRTASVMLETAQQNELAVTLGAWERIKSAFEGSCPLAAAAAGTLDKLVDPVVVNGEHVIIRSKIFASDYLRHQLTWLFTLFSNDAVPLNSPTAEINPFHTIVAPSSRLNDYIAKTIVHHLSSTTLRELGETSELRSCAVTFVRLCGDVAARATSDDASCLSVLQVAMTTVLEALTLFDGCLRQYNVDDKGPTLLLVWGVERYAHEQSEASFALHAALRIARKLEQTFGPGSFSIGVAAGVVFSGFVLCEKRSDHTILGVAVNDAARLMCHPLASEHAILVSEDVYKACKDEFLFSPTSHVVQIKGSIDPKRTYIPIRPLNASARWRQGDRSNPPKLIGREREKMIIRHALEDWKNGEPTTLVIEGKTGTGKTLLGDYTIHEASKVPNSLISVGRSSESQKFVPFHALSVILTSLFTDMDVELLTKKAAHLKRKAGRFDEADRIEQWSGVKYSTAGRRSRSVSMSGLATSLSGLEALQFETTLAKLDSLNNWYDAGAEAKTTQSLSRPKVATADKFPPKRRKTFGAQFLPPKPMDLNSSRTDLLSPTWEPHRSADDEDGSDEEGGESDGMTAASGSTRVDSLHSRTPALQSSTSYPAINAHTQTSALSCHPSCPRRNKMQRDMSANTGDEFGAVHMPECFNAKNTSLLGYMNRLTIKVQIILRLLEIEEPLQYLLNDVIPTNFETTRGYNIVFSQERTSHLIAFVVRILNTLTERFEIPIILMLDHAQWTDSIGCQLFSDISRQCKRVLCCWLTRPVGEYMSDLPRKLLERIMEGDVERVATSGASSDSDDASLATVVADLKEVVPPATVISLHGLDIAASEEMIMEIVRGKFPNATAPDAGLVCEIYRRTGGNPVMIQMLSSSMLQRLDGQVLDGVLQFSRSSSAASTQFDDVLPADAATAVLSKLDRTSPAMRHVLLVMSAAGQYTQLHTLAAALIRNPIKEFANFHLETIEGQQRLLDFLQENDRFGFLKYTFERDPDAAHLLELDAVECANVPPPPTALYCSELYFHHYLVYQSIYRCLIPSRRATLHASYAAHYAHYMDSSNISNERGQRDAMLYVINLHLDRCRALVPSTTLIRFAHEAYKSSVSRAIVAEALIAYQRLEDLMATYPDAAQRVLSLYDRVRVCRLMCDMWIAAVDYSQAWEYFVKGVRYLGQEVPEVRTGKWWRLVLRQVVKHFLVRVVKRHDVVERWVLRDLSKKFPIVKHDMSMVRQCAIELMDLFDSALHIAVHQNSSDCYFALLLINTSKFLTAARASKFANFLLTRA
ncbi:uncharacterized protein EV422DRAFT_327840 [Fimicolochytrium jonesii]|uniref:uncharacterized protein n=1 Tax=Fimicolochytrium jonesii TaxID=1396493 RepID=UPI0022FF3858|nr:uncharacterized protein EV422DRAFT_327840 [Fimicolochytrium jonesii]KAI8816142.1 hypothetical protein EV422DRAFT_327840 [Fimicolochytrium jonesii]